MNRRNLLQAGIIASTTGFTGTNALLNSAFAATEKPLAIDHFICDERFAESRIVSSSFTQANVVNHKVSGDVTDLWYRHLGPAWKNSPITAAGITTESALFYLQRLAWIHQVRLIYHGYHPVPVNSKVQHTFKGSKNLVSNITNMNNQPWPASLGMALTHMDASLSAQDEINISLNLPDLKATNISARDTILVSWVLAPLSSIT